MKIKVEQLSASRLLILLPNAQHKLQQMTHRATEENTEDDKYH